MIIKFTKLAVIGNPPYQIQSEAQQARDGGKQHAKPIYHSFVEGVIDNMNPDYFSMIIPSRWMVGGMGLDNHRDRMMNDTHMKKIVHFGGSHTIFPTVKIDGGVNYFLWEKDYSGDCEFVNGNTTTKRLLNCYDIILQDNDAVGILDKVMKISSSYINSTCYGKKPFGLATNFKKFKESGVKCICQGKKDKFVDSDSFTDKNAILGKWKVCIGAAFGETGTDKFRVFSDPFVIEPKAICTETYIVVNIFDSKKEADCFISYMKTKLFRFMLLQRKATQNMNKDKFSWVPDMLDYSASWSDRELYKHFNLSRQEIAYIESKIKAI